MRWDERHSRIQRALPFKWINNIVNSIIQTSEALINFPFEIIATRICKKIAWIVRNWGSWQNIIFQCVRLSVIYIWFAKFNNRAEKENVVCHRKRCWSEMNELCDLWHMWCGKSRWVQTNSFNRSCRLQ